MLAPLLALGMFGAACGPSSDHPQLPAQGTSDINVTGTVDRGPSPTCPAGEPCDPPMVAAFLVFTRPGAPDVTVQVRGDAFALHLEPGSYTIAPAPPAFQGELQPSSVRVPATGVVTLRLHIVRSG